MTQLASAVGPYVGRTVDVLLFDPPDVIGNSPSAQALALPQQGGALIAGVEKLVQRFLLELLTEQGSMQYLPLRGCSFMTDARHGLWRNPGDVLASFSAACLTVKQNLMDDELESDPLDERFAAAELLNVSVTPSLVSLRIRLSSLAGENRTVLFPLRITNR